MWQVLQDPSIYFFKRDLKFRSWDWISALFPLCSPVSTSFTARSGSNSGMGPCASMATQREVRRSERGRDRAVGVLASAEDGATESMAGV